MQVTKTHVKMLFREERSVFDRWFQAIAIAVLPSHLTTLEYVRSIMIDGMNDLTLAVWDNFLVTLAELRLDPPEVEIDSHDPGKGGCYHIPPNRPKSKIKHFERLANRRRFRDEIREVGISAYTYLPGWFEFVPGVPLSEQKRQGAALKLVQ